MKFTLNLTDYLEQYLTNDKNREPYCPVCYDKCMSFEHKSDIEHIIDCYKEQMIMDKMSKIIESTGKIPAIDAKFVHDINKMIEQEMMKYYE